MNVEPLNPEPNPGAFLPAPSHKPSAESAAERSVLDTAAFEKSASTDIAAAKAEKAPASLALPGQRLSLKEFTAAASIAELRDIYSARGLTFSSERKFLRQVRRDWVAEIKAAKQALAEDPALLKVPNPLPSIQVELGGAPTRIFGIIHEPAAGNGYLKLIAKTAHTSKNCLSEQHLKGTFFPKAKSVELGDHLALSLTDGIREGFRLSPGGIIWGRLKQLGNLLIARPSLHLSDHPFHTAKYFYVNAIKLPPEAFSLSSSLPPYVDLELRSRRNSFTPVQKRSAYMAEFLRAWKPGEEKSIFVGIAHASDIAYFLKHPPADQRYAKQARRHIEKLEKNEQRYERLTSIKGHIWDLCTLGTGYVIGMAALVLPATSLALKYLFA